MTGQHDDRRLEAILAQDAHGLATVDVGQSDIHDNQIDLAVLGGLNALRPPVDRNSVEFLVQRQLFDQRLAQLGVIIDNQNRTLIGHLNKTFHGTPARLSL